MNPITQLIHSTQIIIQTILITPVAAITIAGVCGMLFGGGVAQW